MKALSESQRATYEEMLQVCVCLQLRKATRRVTQLYDQNLRASGLRSTQLPILVTLALTDSATIRLLAQQLAMDRTTLGQNLKPLQAQGLIEIVPGEDRRKREVRLTDSGRDVITRAVPLWEDAQASVVGGVGQERSSVLGEVVGALLSVQRMG